MIRHGLDDKADRIPHLVAFITRRGQVERIGEQSEILTCYSQRSIRPKAIMRGRQ